MLKLGWSLTKIKKAAVLSKHPVWRRALMHGVAATTEHWPLRELIRPRTVVDVGANKGQFSLFALEAFPGCRIFAFEPLRRPAERFRRTLGHYATVELFDAAIGPNSGSAEMYVSEREDSSSLLPMTEKIAEVFPEAVWSGRTQAVRVGRLEDFLIPAQIVRPSLLKLDVQGFELEALKGCRSLLAYFDHLYVECSDVAIYGRQAMRSEITAFLADFGFDPIARLNEVMRERIGLVQCDVLFGRGA